MGVSTSGGSSFRLRVNYKVTRVALLPSGGERLEVHSVMFLAWDRVAKTTHTHSHTQSERSFRERWRLESSKVWETA